MTKDSTNEQTTTTRGVNKMRNETATTTTKTLHSHHVTVVHMPYNYTQDLFSFIRLCWLSPWQFQPRLICPTVKTKTTPKQTNTAPLIKKTRTTIMIYMVNICIILLLPLQKTRLYNLSSNCTNIMQNRITLNNASDYIGPPNPNPSLIAL